MSGQGGADRGGGGHRTRDDPWMGTVTTVSGFLAGFSLAAVVVIADAPEHFRWPGVAVLALTIASVVLIGTAQASRTGAYYYEHYSKRWRHRIWVGYHVGIIALLAGLGAALAPLEGAAGQAGVAGQEGLRWAALFVAFGAAFVEMFLTAGTLVMQRVERKRNYDVLTEALKDLNYGRLEEHRRQRFWCSGVDGVARLVVAAEWEGFLVYRVDESRPCFIPRTEPVKEWLDAHKEWFDANKDEQAGRAAKRVDCRQALKDARKHWPEAPGGEADPKPLDWLGGAAADGTVRFSGLPRIAAR